MCITSWLLTYIPRKDIGLIAVFYFTDWNMWVSTRTKWLGGEKWDSLLLSPPVFYSWDVLSPINRCWTTEIQCDGTKHFRRALGSTYSVPAPARESLAVESSPPVLTVSGEELLGSDVSLQSPVALQSIMWQFLKPCKPLSIFVCLFWSVTTQCSS